MYSCELRGPRAFLVPTQEISTCTCLGSERTMGAMGMQPGAADDAKPLTSIHAPEDASTATQNLIKAAGNGDEWLVEALMQQGADLLHQASPFCKLDCSCCPAPCVPCLPLFSIT